MARTIQMFSSQTGSSVTLFLIVMLCAPYLGLAQTVTFSLPVQGTLGEDVFLVNHVDHDTAKGSFKNYNCKLYTYDGHDGTDFVLRSFRSMDSGVAVLAAADGIVTGVVDSLYDRNKVSIVERGFGNVVSIRHSDGYTTYYAHIKKGSAMVTVGQHVQRGERIALVGSSGNSTDPHLHFEVWRRVDPFAGPCADKASLWNDQQDITGEHMIIDHDVTTWPPQLDTIRERPPHVDIVEKSAKTITAWTLHTGIREGDHLDLTWYTPEGKVWSGFGSTAGLNTNYYYWWSFIDYSHGTMPSGRWRVDMSVNTNVVCSDSFLIVSPTSVQSPLETYATGVFAGDVVEIRDLDGRLLNSHIYELPSGGYIIQSKRLSTSMLILVRDGVICAYVRRSKNTD